MTIELDALDEIKELPAVKSQAKREPKLYRMFH